MLKKLLLGGVCWTLAMPALAAPPATVTGPNGAQAGVDGSSNLQVNCRVGCSGGSVSNASSLAISSTNSGAVAYEYGFDGATWRQLQAILNGSTYALAFDINVGSQIDTDLKAAIPSGTAQIGNLTAETYGAAPALASNLILKASAGRLFAFNVSADSTLSGAAWWVMLFDATSAPGDGAVTPAKCYAVPSGTTFISAGWPAGGVNFLTGITVVVSTNGCFTKAGSVHAFISGDFL